MFRLHIAAIARDIALVDGTRLSAGRRVFNLHLWNEHIPPFPPQGPTLGWARGICDGLEISLQELAAFVASRPAFDDIVAAGGNMVFVSTEQTELVTRLAARYGFVRAVDPTPNRTLYQRLHLFGESILISMIVMSQNPGALRSDFLRRDNVPVYLHRNELMRRFGAPGETSPQL